MTQTSSDYPVILVVDDEPLARMIAVELFEDEGYATLEASSAAEALTTLRDHSEVSIVFTDVEMPGELNGLGLARRVETERPGVGLVLTSGGERPDRQDMPGRGYFLGKPYTRQAVTDLLRRVVS